MKYELDDLKTYLRIDINDDDKILQSLYLTAENYVHDLVSFNAKLEDLEKIEQFNQAVILLTGHWYNARYAVAQTTSAKVNNEEIPFGVNALALQARARYLDGGAVDDSQSTKQSD